MNELIDDSIDGWIIRWMKGLSLILGDVNHIMLLMAMISH